MADSPASEVFEQIAKIQYITRFTLQYHHSIMVSPEWITITKQGVSTLDCFVSIVVPNKVSSVDIAYFHFGFVQKELQIGSIQFKNTADFKKICNIMTVLIHYLTNMRK